MLIGKRPFKLNLYCSFHDFYFFNLYFCFLIFSLDKMRLYQILNSTVFLLFSNTAVIPALKYPMDSDHLPDLPDDCFIEIFAHLDELVALNYEKI